MDEEGLEMRNYLLAKRPAAAAPVVEKKTPFMKEGHSEFGGSGNNAKDSKQNEADKWDSLMDDDDDDDPDLEALRLQRIAQMKKQQTMENDWKSKGHGEYREIIEPDFLKEVTNSTLCVCHFYHNDFERCKIMDMHLLKIAPEILSTKFIKLNAEKAHFFVSKLKVRTLPTLVIFRDGVAVGRLVGFDGVSVSDTFQSFLLRDKILALLTSSTSPEELE